MTRRARDCTEPSKCRSCGADILWARTKNTRTGATSWKPFDAVSDNRPLDRGGGRFVLFVKKEKNYLRAEAFDFALHHSQNRYTSHFATCPNADEHRSPR